MKEQRDLLLVPFPFSDQSGRKIRPVIVISNNSFNKSSQDLIVIGVTSNVLKDKFTIDLKNDDLEEGRLLNNCSIKVENILKIEETLVIKKIGKIKENVLSDIVNKLFQIINADKE